jgi:hypothetical protein
VFAAVHLLSPVLTAGTLNDIRTAHVAFVELNEEDSKMIKQNHDNGNESTNLCAVADVFVVRWFERIAAFATWINLEVSSFWFFFFFFDLFARLKWFWLSDLEVMSSIDFAFGHRWIIASVEIN